jgi:hypothetical protein
VHTGAGPTHWDPFVEFTGGGDALAGLWQRLFDELLNAPGSSAEQYPLEGLRQTFEEYLVDRPEKMRELKLLMMKQTIMLFSM